MSGNGRSWPTDGATGSTGADGRGSAPSLPDDRLVELAERLERLCREHGRSGQLRGLLEETGEEALLDEITALLTENEFRTARLADLLDAVDLTLSAHGVHGLTRPNRQWRALPGVTGSAQGVAAWFCPVARCTRSSGAPGGCALTGRPLDPDPFTP